MAEILVDSYYIERLKDKIDKLSSQVFKLNQELKKTTEDRDNAEFRIRTELEPRIQQERTTYDFWVKQQTGEEQCDYFCSTIDKLCDYVDEQNEGFFDWERNKGDLYEMILFLVKNRKNIKDYKIIEEESEGEWIKHIYHGWEMEIKYECSKCHKEVDFETKHCPNCGKKMKGE